MDTSLLVILAVAVVVVIVSFRRVASDRAARAQAEAQQTPYGSPQPVSQVTTPGAPIADELLKLHELKTSGALTEREFAEAKARLLSGR